MLNQVVSKTLTRPDRNPCGTAAMPSSLIIWLSVASESGFPRGFGEHGDHVGDHDSM